MKIKKEKCLIVANWKMNPVSSKLAKQNFSSIKKVANKMRNVETVVCPPFVYLESLKSTGHRCVIGSQDLFFQPEGSYTGEISFLQLKNMGIKYSIIGHSERRNPTHGEGETDELINLKIRASLKGMITPIVCVGEKTRDEKGDYLSFLKTQIEKAFADLPKNSIKDVVVAYEPIWAIGKDAKRDATPKEVFEISIFIKKVISDIYNTKSVPPTKILYGGSVNEKNIVDFYKESGIDGFLIGRASLDPKKFAEILKRVEEIK